MRLLPSPAFAERTKMSDKSTTVLVKESFLSRNCKVWQEAALKEKKKLPRKVEIFGERNGEEMREVPSRCPRLKQACSGNEGNNKTAQSCTALLADCFALLVSCGGDRALR